MTHAQDQAVLTTLDRSGGWRIRLVRVGWLFIFILLTAIFIASVPSATVYQRRDWLFAEALPAVWPFVSTFTFAAVVVVVRYVALAVFYAVALLIAWRKWNDWFALFVSAALLMVAWGFIFRLESSTTYAPQWLDPFEPYLTGVIQVCFLMSWLLLFFLLPDGRFVPGWSGWFVVFPFIAAVPLFTFDQLRRYIAPRNWEIVGNLAWNGFFFAIILAIAAGLYFQIQRYRNVATPLQRQQMKWILVGLAFQPLPLIFGAGIPSGESWSALFTIFFELFIVCMLPITIGLAVFRRRLWDVDPIINRSFVYGGLTAFILLFYGLIVGGTSMLFQTRAGAAPVLLTTIAAVLLTPHLYRRLDRGVNRLVPMPAGVRSGMAAPEEATTPFSTILSGRKLVIARAGWLAVLGLSGITLAISLRASLAAGLFATMPDAATQFDVALARVFANNQYLAHDIILFVAFIQLIAFLAVGLLLFWRRTND